MSDWRKAFGKAAGNVITVLIVGTCMALLVAALLWASRLIASLLTA